MVGEVGDSQIVVNLPVTNVPGCTGNNANPRGLQHLHFLNMGASDGPPDGTRVVHHGSDELLIQQNTIPDRQTASPIQETSQPQRRFLPHLIDTFRPGESFIKGHPKTTGVLDPLGWLPEELN